MKRRLGTFPYWSFGQTILQPRQIVESEADTYPTLMKRKRIPLNLYGPFIRFPVGWASARIKILQHLFMSVKACLRHGMHDGWMNGCKRTIWCQCWFLFLEQNPFPNFFPWLLKNCLTKGAKVAVVEKLNFFYQFHILLKFSLLSSAFSLFPRPYYYEGFLNNFIAFSSSWKKFQYKFLAHDNK